jgi:hypothetical protein
MTFFHSSFFASADCYNINTAQHENEDEWAEIGNDSNQQKIKETKDPAKQKALHQK